LPNIVRPPSVLRATSAQTVKGKYKITHKKVVSNFSKERTGRIDFLNPS
jgi:hypothetical protein